MDVIARFVNTDGSPATGLTPTMTIWDSAGTQVVNAAAMTEIGGGAYVYAFASYDDTKDYVVLGDAGSGVSTSVRYSYGTTGDQGAVAQVQTSVAAIPTTPLLAANYVAPDNADIAAIKAKTDNLPASPAAVGSAMTLTSGYDAAKSAASQSSVNALEALVAPSGSYTVTIQTVLPDGVTPIQGAGYQVSQGGQLYTFGTTDATGTATFLADNGTYSIQCQKFSTSFPSAQSFTVAGADLTETIEGSEASIPVPTQAGLCTVYEYCLDASGGPLQSIVASAQITSLPFSYGGAMYAGQMIGFTYNSTSGLLQWKIVQGATVAFVLRSLGVSKSSVIPSQTTARLQDLTAV